MSFTIDIDVDALAANVAQAETVYQAGIRDAVKSGVDFGVEAAKGDHPYQDHSEEGLTASIKGQFDGNLTGAIRADASYASYVEGGTRAHVIEAKPRVSADGKTRPGFLAFNGGFARRVNHPGTSPLPFIQPAADLAGEHIVDYIETVVTPRVNEIING